MSEEETKFLNRQRGAVKSKLTLFSNHLRTLEGKSLSEAELINLEERISKADTIFADFDKLQNQIQNVVSESEIESQYQERSIFEDTFFATIARAKQMVLTYKKEHEQQISANASTSGSSNHDENNVQVLKGVKFPVISLPNFDGNMDNWLEFRDTFQSLIHDNGLINNIQKYHYLRACLTNGASQVIRSIELSASNYPVAWETLCERYNNNQLLVHIHTKALFNLEPIQKECASKLRNLLDNVSKHLRSLQQLGEPTDQWDTLINYLVTTKLDSKTTREWEQHKIVSELVSSTLSNNNNEDTEADNEYSREKFITNIGIGLIELLFSSLWLCYGIFFAEYVRVDTVKDGLWATILYTSIFHISAPWSKSLVGEWYENNKHQKMIFRLVVFVSTCILFIGVSFSKSIVNYSYGICGGLAHRIVTTQLRFIAMKKFKMDEAHLQCNVQPAKAICLLVLPHLQLLLVENYTIAGSFLVYAAFLLSIVPASLIVRHPRESEDSGYDADYPDMSRYRTLSVFSRQMREMEDFSKPPYSATFTISTSNTPSIEDEEEILENEEDTLKNYANPGVDVDEDQNSPKIKPLTHETVQFYYSNMGVNILPDIPEEPETESELGSSRRNTIDAKRLSRISAALEELNRKGNAERVIVRETVIGVAVDERLAKAGEEVSNENEEIAELVVATDTLVKLPVVGTNDEIRSIEYIHDIHSGNSRNLLKKLQHPVRTFCRCSPYKVYVWKQRFRRVKDLSADHFFLPLRYSLTDIHFYPTLVSKVAILLNSTIFVTLAPHLFLGKNGAYKKVDTTFLLSYMAFSWCLFLVFLPLVVTFSKLRMRYTFSVGLLLIAFSMLLLSKNKMTNELITWSSLLFGFGFGMVNFSENLVYASFLNDKKPNTSEGTLNVMSGFSVILVYYLIYDYDLCKLDIVELFPTVSSYCHVIMAGFWMTVSLVKLCIVRVKKYRK